MTNEAGFAGHLLATSEVETEARSGTPAGPWHVESDGGTFYVVHPGTVCTVTTVCAIETDGSKDPEATAHRIAAAPDLYEALRRMVRTYDGMEDGMGEPCSALIEGRAALARAHGEQA